MIELTHCYIRFPEELDNRLDVLYNDTLFDNIPIAMDRSKYNFRNLSCVVYFNKLSRNPMELPEDEFEYVEIGRVDLVKGKANSIKMLGKEATSSRVRKVIKRNNVIVSTTRPTRGAIAIIPSKLDNQICSTGFAVLETKASIIPEFLFLALRMNLTTKQFEKHCSGSGYPAISQEYGLPKIKIPVPNSIGEQEEIIHKIKPFQYRALRYEILAKKVRSQIESLFLGEIGIAIDNNINFVHKSGRESTSFSFYCFDQGHERLDYLYYHPHYEILESIKKYTNTTLSKIIYSPVVRGKTPDYVDGEEGIPVIKTVDLTNQGINLESCLRVDKDFFEANPEIHIKRNDILIASTGLISMGKVDIFEHDDNATCDGHVSIVRLNEGYDPLFVTMYLRSVFGQIQIEKYFTGSSGQIEIQPHDIGKIILPDNTKTGVPLEKQKLIGKKVKEALDKAIVYESLAREKWYEVNTIFEDIILR